MADIPFDIPALTTVRNILARSPEVAGADLVDIPAEGPDGRFRLTLADGTKIRVDLVILRAGNEG